jgi:hypothetical protein
VDHIFGYFDALQLTAVVLYLGYRALKHQPPFNK